MPVSGKILLELRFVCIREIRELPYFHGPQWHGLFETVMAKFLSDDMKMGTVDIWIHPVETGVCRYEAGDCLHLGLTFPEKYASPMLELIRNFNLTDQNTKGHFQPGHTLNLKKVCCRISGAESLPDEIDPTRLTPLMPDMLADEISTLAGLENFSIRFSAPLRCKRPDQMKRPGHKYMDPDFFLEDRFQDASPATALMEAIAGNPPEGSLTDDLQIIGGSLTMVDNTYGRYEKPVGGTLGTIRLSGRVSAEAARHLVFGQYTGVGKNRSFGLGFYEIPELQAVKNVRPLCRGKTLFDRLADPKRLFSALEKLPKSSPGPDGLSKTDVMKAGTEVIERLSRQIRDQTYASGTCKKFQYPKKDGSFRKIVAYDYMDRIVQRATADLLAPAAESILSRATYAFRKGLNRKGAGKALRDFLNQGYTVGIRTDITAFFDSVDTLRLKDLLEGLFAADPISGFIIDLIDRVNLQSEGRGLPQGSPLSPLLSNLYLDRFDKMVIAEGFKLIRYSDDFVILVKPSGLNETELQEIISEKLTSIGLCLSKEKTQSVSPETGIRFLGYRITPAAIQPDKPEPTEEDDNWLPVFKEEWLSGHPVYISSICRGAYSSGADLFINLENDRKEKIPWKQINRIVVVGRSSLSGGVLYRAVREEIPVTFIDVMGKFCGHLIPTDGSPPSMADLQRQTAADPVYCLNFAKKIIAAQIHNRFVVLRRYKKDQPELSRLAQSAESSNSLEQLRGFEGNAARIFYQQFAQMIDPFVFKGRKYYPPPDPINVMLSFGYTLLRRRLAAALLEKGFNTRMGFYHQQHGGHDTLVSDLMEELRHIIERMVLTLIHRKEIKPDEFEDISIKGYPACRLKGNAFRKIVRQFENTMAKESSYQGETMSMNAYLDEMADTLRRSLKLNIPYTPIRIH